ncbi:hypothetical protein ACHAWF_013323 [Thalassiosira exigua]
MGGQSNRQLGGGWKYYWLASLKSVGVILILGAAVVNLIVTTLATPSTQHLVHETMLSKRSSQSGVIPEALQPVTFTGCCKPAIFNDSTNMEDVSCYRGTCYNRRPCEDPLYPFSSEEEKALLPQAEQSSMQIRLLRKECLSPDRATPPMEWCQNPLKDTGRDDQVAQLVQNIPPAGCTAVSHGGGSGAFQHALVFPSAKFVFCGIPKVGITKWEMFLRFYMGAKDYPSMPHFKSDRGFLLFDSLDPEAQRRIWEDREWTWAAIIREPAERLLSAFLDKVKARKFEHLNGTMTFKNFIDNLSNSSLVEVKGMHGLSWQSDPHWRPQVYSCGISERLDRFQFIGELGKIGDHTKELLQHVGLWDSHGKHFINGGVRVGGNKYCNIQSHPANSTRHVGFQQKDKMSNATAAETEYGHTTNSQKNLEQFYTPELLRMVQDDLYPYDYKLWKLVSDGKKLSQGKELMLKLSPRCSDRTIY